MTFFKNLPSKLARVTSGGQIIKEIDGLRFLAIFPVVLQHLSERFLRETAVTAGPEDIVMQAITLRGFIGVFIFFVISGFILGLPFAATSLANQKKVDLKKYYWRRVTRLEPPYIIAMTIFAVAAVIMGMMSLTKAIPHYFASIFYLHNIIYSGWTHINPPVWTLEIEVQFYILAPFLAILTFKVSSLIARRTLLIGLMLVMLIIQSYFDIPHDLLLKLTLLNHLHYFLLGFLLSDIYLTEWRNGIKKNTIFNYLGIASFAALILIWNWDHYFVNRVGFTICLFILFISVFKATWLNRFFSLPWITAIGGMCYSIYLIHLPFIELFMMFTKNIVVTDSLTINYLIQLIMLLPFLLMVSIAFYLLIEKPCMYKDWPQRLKKLIMEKPYALKQSITEFKRNI